MELLKPKRPVKGMVVASEKHEDGSPHLHAFVLLKSRYDCTNCHFWDINVGDEVYHPNVQKCRKARSEGRGADRNDHEPGRPSEVV